MSWKKPAVPERILMPVPGQSPSSRGVWDRHLHNPVVRAQLQLFSGCSCSLFRTLTQNCLFFPCLHLERGLRLCSPSGSNAHAYGCCRGPRSLWCSTTFGAEVLGTLQGAEGLLCVWEGAGGLPGAGCWLLAWGFWQGADLEGKEVRGTHSPQWALCLSPIDLGGRKQER